MVTNIQNVWYRFLAMLMRTGPDWVRHWRLLTASLNHVRHFETGSTERMVTTRLGLRMKVRMDDWLGQHVYATGDYEPPTTAVIQSLTGSGNTLVDIGGNIGYFALLFAKQTGPDGQVYAFEPIVELCGRLQENIRLNRFHNIFVSPVAASDIAGTHEFFVGPESHMGISSLRQIKEASQKIRVQTMRLDEFDFGKGSINLVKIDVEGAECAVLRGMQATLTRDHPDLIIEVTDSSLREMGDSASEMFTMLEQLGYRAYMIAHDGLRPLSQWTVNLPQQFNALFTCRESLPTILNVIEDKSA